MCGIAGIWGGATKQRLQSMVDRLAHRGPDDESIWVQSSHDVGFGHRRLAIIDLNGGRQPIANEDGRVVTVFNGAIYNYRPLRDDLESRGHRFKTQTDTEVIVHLYEDHGADFVSMLRGMFAIAVWDENERQLVLTRDRAGKKPLYYAARSGSFVFASEIKGVVPSLDSVTIDQQALADYLTWGHVPAPATIYEEIRSLLPGEIMVVRDRRVDSRKRYWRQQLSPKDSLSAHEAVERTDVLLREAVRLRLHADVPVGCFLSGGIDSGIITAMATQECTGRLTTITVGFADDTFDERPAARTVAERYGTDHHELLLQTDVVADLPAIVAGYDQPFADSSSIPSYYVARAARQLVKVVLNGDGGDELFAGYRRYVAARVGHWVRWTDGPFGRALWSVVANALPTPRSYRSAYAFGHRLIRGLGADPVERYLAWAVDVFDAPGKRRLCGDDAAQDLSCAWMGNAKDSARSVREVFAQHGAIGAVDRMLGADFALILPNDLLVKMDIACMAHGLEVRSPFLDHELIEVVSRFPDRIKQHGFTTKPLLRALSGRYLPEDIQCAPKRGFEVPLARWLAGDLRDLSRDVILSRHGLLAGLFDRPALERLLRNESGADPAGWARRVWTLLMLGMWDRHVNRASGSGPSE